MWKHMVKPRRTARHCRRTEGNLNKKQFDYVLLKLTKKGFSDWWNFTTYIVPKSHFNPPHSHSIICNGTGSLMLTHTPTPLLHTFSQMSSWLIFLTPPRHPFLTPVNSHIGDCVANTEAPACARLMYQQKPGMFFAFFWHQIYPKCTQTCLIVCLWAYWARRDVPCTRFAYIYSSTNCPLWSRMKNQIPKAPTKNNFSFVDLNHSTNRKIRLFPLAFALSVIIKHGLYISLCIWQLSSIYTLSTFLSRGPDISPLHLVCERIQFFSIFLFCFFFTGRLARICLTTIVYFLFKTDYLEEKEDSADGSRNILCIT
jgi:hypothetical protein